jgi:hypothetical protein
MPRTYYNCHLNQGWSSPSDTVDRRQYHPVLRKQWEKQITAYDTNLGETEDVNANVSEGFVAGWDDPYAWIRPWTIIDFFRTFKLTK